MMSNMFLLVLIGCALGVQAFREQSTRVVGRVLCDRKPFASSEIRLIDIDTGRPDDEMSKVLTDSNGEYTLAGFASDLVGSIDPVVRIKFKCGHWFNKCYEFKVPSKYVSDGKVPKQTFNAPEIELSSVKPNCDW